MYIVFIRLNKKKIEIINTTALIIAYTRMLYIIGTFNKLE